MSKFIDLTDQKFDRLTVLERVENTKKGRACWKCQCSCGNTTTVPSGDLRSGKTKSCGCLNNELRLKRSTTHGMTHSPEYNVWHHMIKRCHNPTNDRFKDYGGRGITVCDEWRHDFMAFYNHVGKRPSKKLMIERVDNSKGYIPGNVIWETRQAQANNKRNNHKITIHGWTMNLCQWARFVGKNYHLVQYRLKKGWPPAKAIWG